VGELSYVREKVGIRWQASKDLLKEVFNRIACALMGVEHGVAVEELRKCKKQLAAWVEHNEPERQAHSKFTKKRWRRINNNAMERLNKLMCSLRRMSIL